jgi:hypothetical protein
MRIYALTTSHSPNETVDLFVTREAAEAELDEILEDGPEWVDVLRRTDPARRATNLKQLVTKPASRVCARPPAPAKQG